MSQLWALFQPGFLLHNAFWGSLAIGLFCPLVGVYFMLRRMTLLGAALPQISAMGIALVFFLQQMGWTWSLHPGEANDRMMALAGSILVTIAAVVVLAWLEKKGQGTTDSRIGALLAVSYAASILLVVSNPHGQVELLNMLQGEVVAISHQDFVLVRTGFAILIGLLLLFHRHFLLVSYDRDFATIVGCNVLAWDVALFAIIETGISMSVLLVGPMMTFAFLVIPPLAVRRFCKRMSTFFLLSSLTGGLSAIAGFYISYRWDWPLSPTNIAVAFLILLISFFGKILSP